jgi:alpha-amylase
VAPPKAPAATSPPAPALEGRTWQDEILYFVMVDRFANGDRSNDQGIRPGHPEGFHGGDWQGVIDHLDELQKLGVTTLWLSPPYLNDSDFLGMQGYHGYWVMDFHKPDPHLGDMAKLKELVDRAHARGMKVILDLIVNHVGYNHPWVKDPSRQDWFHHEGDINFVTESALENGNLRGLPDLAQENPEVSDFLIQHARYWVDQTGIDGFRVDAVKHVPRWWLARFAEEMRKAYGEDFLLVGEAYSNSPRRVAEYQSQGGLTSLFDFPVANALRSSIGYDEERGYTGILSEAWKVLFQYPYEAWRMLTTRPGNMKVLARTLRQDQHYPNPYLISTMVDNHDMPRFGSIAGPQAREKLKLALLFLLTSRGIPCLYQGTEHGMGLHGEANRDDVKFGQDPEMFAYLSRLNHLRQESVALRRGRQVELHVDPDVFAFARVHPREQVVVALNRAPEAARRRLPVDLPEGALLTDALSGRTYQVSQGLLEVDIPPRGGLVLRHQA